MAEATYEAIVVGCSHQGLMVGMWTVTSDDALLRHGGTDGGSIGSGNAVFSRFESI